MSQAAQIVEGTNDVRRARGPPELGGSQWAQDAAFKRASAVIDAWMGSPGHRSNLLDASLTEIGVGCVLDGTSMLCSQVFLGP